MTLSRRRLLQSVAVFGVAVAALSSPKSATAVPTTFCGPVCTGSCTVPPPDLCGGCARPTICYANTEICPEFVYDCEWDS